jgi:hypothetical protein
MRFCRHKGARYRAGKTRKFADWGKVADDMATRDKEQVKGPVCYPVHMHSSEPFFHRQMCGSKRKVPYV